MKLKYACPITCKACEGVHEEDNSDAFEICTSRKRDEDDCEPRYGRKCRWVGGRCEVKHEHCHYAKTSTSCQFNNPLTCQWNDEKEQCSPLTEERNKKVAG